MSLTLLDWRRRVASLYSEVRAGATGDAEGTLGRFRSGRDDLFASHPESPLEADARKSFTGLAYWPYRDDLRFDVEIDTHVDHTPLPIEGSDGRTFGFTRFATVHLPIGDLDLYWLDGYGGGVFLPFRDATCGNTTYGGGRYLLDTVKGADLGGEGGRLILDFNYAYHPSCFYSDAWACPLAPRGNRLAIPVEAGERSR